jgi:hypothetical protein
MTKELETIKEMHNLEKNLDNTIDRAYRIGKLDGVLEYLAKKDKEGDSRSNITFNQ